MEILLLIIGMVFIELIQILLSKYKIGKWILPILSVLFTINFIIAATSHDADLLTNDGIIAVFKMLVSFIIMILSIPTIILICTNIIMRKKKEWIEKNSKGIKISIIITMILLMILGITIYRSSFNLMSKVKTEDIKVIDQ